MGKIRLELFGALAIFNVVRDTVPFNDPAGFIPQWNGASQKPAILRICCAAVTHLNFEEPARRQRGMPFLDMPFEILDVNGVLPARSHGVLRREARVFPP